jgi:serine/threonine protein kinase
MPNGNMNDIVHPPPGKRTPAWWNVTTKTKAVFGTAVGMAYLHFRRVLHRDLKPDNIYFDINHEPVVGDFGLSRNCIQDIHRTQGAMGSPFYLAPEIFMDGPDPPDGQPAYDTPADVYSFGLTLYAMLSPKFAIRFKDGFIPPTAQRLMMRVAQGDRYEKIDGVSDYYWGLIERCWDQVPDNRPSFEELIREFQRSHEYVFPGADMDEVRRYEERMMAAAKPPPLDDDLAELLGL